MSSTLTATRTISSLTNSERERLSLLLAMDDTELNAKSNNLIELGKLARADSNAHQQVIERLNKWLGPYSLPDVDVNHAVEGREIFIHDLKRHDKLMQRISMLRDDLNRRLGNAPTRIGREVTDAFGREVGNIYLVCWPKGTYTLFTQATGSNTFKLHAKELAATNSPLESLSITELFLAMDSTSF